MPPRLLYLRKGTGTVGPYTEAQLQAMVAGGRVGAADLVSADRQTWMPLSGALFLPSPPSRSGRAASFVAGLTAGLVVGAGVAVAAWTVHRERLDRLQADDTAAIEKAHEEKLNDLRAEIANAIERGAAEAEVEVTLRGQVEGLRSEVGRLREEKEREEGSVAQLDRKRKEAVEAAEAAERDRQVHEARQARAAGVARAFADMPAASFYKLADGFLSGKLDRPQFVVAVRNDYLAQLNAEIDAATKVDQLTRSLRLFEESMAGKYEQAPTIVKLAVELFAHAPDKLRVVSRQWRDQPDNRRKVFRAIDFLDQDALWKDTELNLALGAQKGGEVKDQRREERKKVAALRQALSVE